MAIEVVMPKLGWNMETGHIVEWLKRDGDMVQAGDALFTVETDKALTDVEALDSGVLRIPPDAPAPGQDVPIGAVLAYLAPEGEPAPFEQTSLSAVAASNGAMAEQLPVGAAPATAEPGAATSLALNGVPPASPRARRVAAELAVDWQTLCGSGRSGRIVERDVRAAAPRAATGAGVRATPLARRLAEQAGVDFDQLAGVVPGKRISRADVEAAAPIKLATDALADEVARLEPVRRLIGERMTQSAHSVAAVTLTTEVDATAFVKLREQIKVALERTDSPAPAYHDLLARLVALALLEHPDLNASLSGDDVVRHRAVHIGIAVDTERGLLVPVVRDAQRKSVRAIAAESAGLIKQARSGRIAPSDLQGSTFTITNLGMYGIDAFTPIINLPECAILGVGRILAKPVVVDEATELLGVRRMMALSLTFDHRVVDGGAAARFLRRVAEFVEQPVLWLVR